MSVQYHWKFSELPDEQGPSDPINALLQPPTKRIAASFVTVGGYGFVSLRLLVSCIIVSLGVARIGTMIAAIAIPFHASRIDLGQDKTANAQVDGTELL